MKTFTFIIAPLFLKVLKFQVVMKTITKHGGIMKKTLLIIISIMICCSLLFAGCGDQSNNNPNNMGNNGENADDNQNDGEKMHQVNNGEPITLLVDLHSYTPTIDGKPTADVMTPII